MEVYHQIMACGRFEQIHTILHGGLCVAVEEIDLDTGDAFLFKPRELALAVFGLVKPVERTGSAVVHPCRRRVILNHQLNAF